MKLTETIKLSLTKEQERLIRDSMDCYIHTVNSLVQTAIRGTSIFTYTSKDVTANLPAVVKNQCIRDAKSILKRHYKNCHKAVLKNRHPIKREIKPLMAPALSIVKSSCCYWNNQNYAISRNIFSKEDTVYLSVPVMINGKSKRIHIKTRCTEEQYDAIKSHKLGTLRIVSKNNKLVAQVSIDETEPEYKSEDKVMGIDLGIKCPAVTYTSDGKVKFYGNGRQNKYIRRHYKYLRKKLQKSKRLKAVKRIDDKEQRIMKDIDHKISRSIIDEAVKQDISVVKLEQLANIRNTARKSRKNNHSLHTWSFHRLAKFIEYKAKLAGIKVVYVNPAYTSKKCPKCGSLNCAEDRRYKCKCGYHTHRDIVGAINICVSTEYVGNRHTA